MTKMRKDILERITQEFQKHGTSLEELYEKNPKVRWLYDNWRTAPDGNLKEKAFDKYLEELYKIVDRWTGKDPLERDGLAPDAGAGSGLKLSELAAVQAILRDFGEFGQLKINLELRDVFHARIDRLGLEVEALPDTCHISEESKIAEIGSLRYQELSAGTPISDDQRMLQEAYLDCCLPHFIRVPEWEKEFEQYCQSVPGLKAVADFWSGFKDRVKSIEAFCSEESSSSPSLIQGLSPAGSVSPARGETSKVESYSEADN